MKRKRPFTGEARPVEVFVIVPAAILILAAIFGGILA
jgi:hypothetical protein